jgi:hypothetical protein
MKKIKIIYLLLFAISITSCSPIHYYQVYDIESENTIKNDNNFLYSNNDCELKYDFWGKGGEVFFIFTNKTNTDICIDLKRSSFIQNDFAYNYYEQEIITANSISTSASMSSVSSSSVSNYYSDKVINYFDLYNGNYTKEITNAQNYKQSYTINTASVISEKNQNEIWIPANSSKIISVFNISSYAYLDCEDKEFTFPKKYSKIKKFTKQDTPLTFRNRILYRIADNKEEKVIDNEFWISNIINYTQDEFSEFVNYYDCFNDMLIESFEDYKYKRFDKFYNIYERKDAPIKKESSN